MTPEAPPETTSGASPGATPERSPGERPFVSVILPCRNESRFIEGCLDSILASDYPASRTEILVVDGRSTDGTRETVEDYAARHPRVRLVDNPERRTPHGVNRGLARARGEVIVRMDAHAAYPPEYIGRCVRGLARHDADNVGGVWDTVAREDTAVGRAIAAVHSHPLGVGNAWFRIGVDEPREVDTVPFGCYRREAMDRLGGYRERLHRAQDLDLNTRLREEGGRIVLDPAIRAVYFVRSTVPGALLHRVRSGYWTVNGLRYGGRSLAPRHAVPIASLVAGAALLTAWLAGSGPAGWVLAGLGGVFGVLDLVASVGIGRREGAAAGAWAALLFPLLHLGYGLGQAAALPKATAAGLSRLVPARLRPWSGGRGP